MLFGSRLIEPRRLTEAELELCALDDQIEARMQLQKVLRKDWESLGIIGRRTKTGVQLEVKLADLEVKIRNLKSTRDKKAGILPQEVEIPVGVFHRICQILCLVTIGLTMFGLIFL